MRKKQKAQLLMPSGGGGLAAAARAPAAPAPAPGRQASGAALPSYGSAHDDRVIAAENPIYSPGGRPAWEQQLLLVSGGGAVARGIVAT